MPSGPVAVPFCKRRIARVTSQISGGASIGISESGSAVEVAFSRSLLNVTGEWLLDNVPSSDCLFLNND